MMKIRVLVTVTQTANSIESSPNITVKNLLSIVFKVQYQ